MTETNWIGKQVNKENQFNNDWTESYDWKGLDIFKES